MQESYANNCNMVGIIFLKRWDIKTKILTVRLGDTLEFVLLLDSVAVARTTGSVDQLISQAFSNGLDVTEGSLSGTSAQKPDSLVHTSQGRHIDSLSPDCSLSTNTCGVLTGTRVDDSINNNLQRVLASGQVNDLKAVLDNTDCHDLLTIVTTVHHQTVDQTLNNGALCLLKTLGGES